MAKSRMVSGRGAGRTLAGSLEYHPVGSGPIYTGNQSVETSAQIVHRTAGTFSNLYFRVSAHSGGVATVLRPRKAGANINLVATATSNTTGAFEDTTHTDVISSGDLLSYSFDTNLGSTCTWRVAAMTFDATGTTATRCIDSLFPSTQAQSTAARFHTLQGKLLSTNATEANSKTRIQKAGTIANLAIYYEAGANAGTLVSRINGADGTLSVSISGANGWFEDTTHSDTISAGNDVNSSRTMGGTASVLLNTVAMDFKDATSGYSIQSCADDTPIAVAQAVTNYYSVSGDTSANTTEAFVKCLAKDAYTASNLTINLTANTVTAASNLKFRKSGVDGTQVATITASTPGTYTDSTHTDALIATDDMNYVLIAGTGGTSITLSYMDMMMTSGAAAVTIPQTVYVQWEES